MVKLAKIFFLTFLSIFLFSSQLFPKDMSSDNNNKKLVKVEQQTTKKTLDLKNNVTIKTPDLNKMIGQMLMLGFKGTEPHHTGVKQVRDLLASGKIGGVIFMGENMRSKKQITELIAFLKKATPQNNPPFLSIDQEGGKVQRLQSSHGFSDIPTAQTIAAKQSKEQAFGTYKQLAKELAEVGINMNFGPVVDLNIVPQNPIIGKKERSYGREVKQVNDYARAFVLAHREYGILTSLKHFPGHGSSWTDSHKQFVDLSKTWRSKELEPYQVMMKEKLADTIMVGHLYHPRFSDTKLRPASLSRKAITDVLRREIGFKGLVITDDLGMGAVKKNFTLKKTLIYAVNAGNDILLLVDGEHSTTKGIERLYAILRQAVLDGEIKLADLVAASQRIEKVKSALVK